MAGDHMNGFKVDDDSVPEAVYDETKIPAVYINQEAIELQNKAGKPRPALGSPRSTVVSMGDHLNRLEVTGGRIYGNSSCFDTVGLAFNTHDIYI